VRVGVFIGTQTPDAGGGYVFAWEIVRALCALAHGSAHRFVILAEAATAAGVRALGGEVEVATLPRPSVVARAREALWRHSSAARAHLRSPGWLQTHAAQHGVDFLWCVAPGSHFLDIPYAAMVWDLQHRTLPWFPEVAAGGEWERRERLNALFLPRASLVLTGTEVGAQEVVRSYGVPRESIVLLPHPTPGYALKPPPADGHYAARAPANPLIVYPAQFWPHKNHVALLHALAQLRSRHGIHAELALPGSDKGNRGYCERVVDELGLRDAVRFLGFVAVDQLVALYREAAALAYVSFGGPENLPPLEAFALGCPVLAADVPGAQEQLGDAALLVDPRSPEAIADGLARIIREPRLADTLRARGRSRAQLRTAESFVRTMFECLDGFAAVRRAWPTSASS
jgi:glycosyltransferase involved in cell wall biosynthesis